jgi:hypothetical protein
MNTQLIEFLKKEGAKHVSTSNGYAIFSCILDKHMPHHSNGDRKPSGFCHLSSGVIGCFVLGKKFSLKEYLALANSELDISTIKDISNSVEGFKLPTVELIESYLFPEKLLIPEYDMSVIEDYQIYNAYIKGRRISETVARAHKLGYNRSKNCIIIPHIWKDRLVGWQERYLEQIDYRAKYKNSSKFPKRNTLFTSIDPKKGEPYLVFEGSWQVMRMETVDKNNALGLFGAQITYQQKNLLSRYPEIWLWLDNDSAGIRSSLELAEHLHKQNVKVSFIDLIGQKDDASSMSSDEIDARINDRFSYSEGLGKLSKRLEEIQKWKDRQRLN